MPPLRCLLLDNYDSYTYNLYQLLAVVNGGEGEKRERGIGRGESAVSQARLTTHPTTAPPTVVRNDEAPWSTLSTRLTAGEWQCVVVSPGPGTPTVPADVGVCAAAVTGSTGVPVLGVCLGMQALALAHGGAVVRAPEPVHGRLSQVEHTDSDVFAGTPSGAAAGNLVVRYHSLCVPEATLPPCLVPIAWTVGPTVAVATAASGGGGDGTVPPARADRVLMGLRHATLPLYGVQFHPESIATTHGAALLANFRDIALAAAGLPAGPRGAPAAPPPPPRLLPPLPPGKLHIVTETVHAPTLATDAQPLFDGVVLPACAEAAASSPCADAWWLDSAATDRARWSFMGAPFGGGLWHRLEYRLPAPGAAGNGTLTRVDAAGTATTVPVPRFFDHLDAALAASTLAEAAEAAAGATDLPFVGGYVGYLGYELKSECGGAREHASSHADAALAFADRLLAVDHAAGGVTVVALHDGSAGEAVSAAAWVAATAARVREIDGGERPEPSAAPPPNTATPPTFTVTRGRATYQSDVTACLDAMTAGESYELCLTTALVAEGAPLPDALAFYRTLRRVNPAPYGAFLAVAGTGPRIACSSPERFLRGARDGGLEAKPIKGTAPRGTNAAADAASAAALAASEKDRAENLMIVDLLRNDLGRVCQPGSVTVPALMAVESYATVHQLVSTVAGARDPKRATPVAAIAAAFPGGSMTGAPKVRSMALLDGLEGAARGVYSGCIGYLCVRGGFDLNIVIRTAVFDGDGQRASIGAGGAVVVQSTPEGEYDEMLLKARALLAAVGAAAGCGSAARVVD